MPNAGRAEPCGGEHSPTPLHGEGRAFDHASGRQAAGGRHTGVERGVDRTRVQCGHRHRDRPVAEIAVLVERAGRLAADSGVIHVDRVGDQCRGRVGQRGVAREHGDRVRDPERVRTALPSAGRDAAHRRIGHDLDTRARDRLAQRRHHADRQPCSGFEMQGDVAAVVDVCALDPRLRREHRRRLVGHGARHRGHRGDERSRARPHRSDHAARNRTRRQAPDEGTRDCAGAEALRPARRASREPRESAPGMRPRPPGRSRRRARPG